MALLPLLTACRGATIAPATPVVQTVDWDAQAEDYDITP